MKKLFVIAFLCLGNCSIAQNDIQYVGIEQGLSNDYVTDIYQDKTGFMWFGTNGGLNRFDGYDFTNYRNIPVDNSSLPDNRITDITEDKDGNMWIATKVGAAVLHKNQKGFTRLRLWNTSKQLDSIDFSIHQLETNRQGQLFAGSGQAGLLAIEKYKNGFAAKTIPLQLEKQSQKKQYNVHAMCKTDNDQLWVVVQGIGLCYYDEQSNSLRLKVGGNFNATTMTSSSDGDIWFSTNWGLRRYRPTTNIFTDFSAANGLRIERIVHLYFGKDQKMWVCTDGGGIQKIDIHTGEIMHNDHGINELLTSNAVFSVYEDQQARQWIGTLRGGINVIDPNKGKFKLVANSFSKKKIDTRDFVLSIAEAGDDKLWIGTEGAGLRKWDVAQQTFSTVDFPSNHPLNKAFVTDIVQDEAQQLWIATYDQGVSRLNTKTGALQSYPCFYPNTSYANQAIWRLYKDSKQQLWVATLNGGHLYKLDAKAQQFMPVNVDIRDVLVISEEHENSFWFGSWAEVFHFNPTSNTYTKYPIGTPVRFIVHTDRQYAWIGTEGGGLLHFNKKTGQFKRYTEKDGLPSNTLLNALQDEAGNIWISSYNGLSKFNPGDLSFQNFNKTDGLQSNQFSYNAALKRPNGELVFGGIRGFNSFRPADLTFKSKFPTIAITQLSIDNKPYSNEIDYQNIPLATVEELVIPYDKAVLSISFAALEYTLPDKIKYAYFLEGWDKDWNYVDKQRSAHYSHLKEGTYTFRIKSTDASGKWNTAERTISIQILPPWWRSVWAYLFYTTMVVAALYIYKSYVKHKATLLYKLKTSEFERDKEHELHEKKITFFTHIAHEFRTPLTLIVNPLKEMLYPLHPDVDTAHLELHQVYNNAKRLLGLVDKLLLFQKAESEFDELRLVRLNIVSLSQEVFYCFQQLAHARQIAYTFESNIETCDIFGDREKLEISLFNLFHNALKFTAEGGQVFVTLTAKKGEVKIEIADSGNNRHTNLSDNIFKPFQRDYGSNSQAKEGFGIGLFLVKKFIEAQHGKVHFESNNLGGTSFSISLPIESTVAKDRLIYEDVAEHSVFLNELLEDEDTAKSTAAVSVYEDEKNANITSLTTERDIMLLVDDNPDIRSYVCKIFQADFDIVQAENGEEALHILRKLEPSIVISDVVMHGISGIDLCEKIKKNSKLSHIPVILLTASFSAEIKLKGIEGGADDYITKPFEKELLTARVRNLLDNRHRLHQYFHSEITLQTNDHKIPAAYKDFLQQAMLAVETHILDADFTVKMLADQLGMSHSNLYRKIKSISGKSANEFIRYIRLRKVACTLIDTNANINEAAYSAGFNDIKHFRQQFSKLFGCTPSLYRKRYAHLKNKYHLSIKQ